MLVGFKWLDEGESQNYSDLFPEEVFQSNAHQLPFEHDCLTPNGKFYARARCLLSVNGTEVKLDYEAFPEYNKQHGMLLGITYLNYLKGDPQTFQNVHWKNISESESYECKVKSFTKRSSPRIQDTDFRTSQWAQDHAQNLSSIELLERLPIRGSKPPKIAITTYAYLRNPYVVAYTLKRANGYCEGCGRPAPFISAATGAPYLEVHHKTPLSEGGSDDTENTIALCPNCHRAKHYAK